MVNQFRGMIALILLKHKTKTQKKGREILSKKCMTSAKQKEQKIVLNIHDNLCDFNLNRFEEPNELFYIPN